MRSRWLVRSTVLVLTVGAFAASSTAGAAETPQTEKARIPYSALCNMAGVGLKADGLPPVTNRQHRLQITSTRPGVKAEDIRLHVETKSGDIPIRVEKDGTFDLPIRDELLTDDAFVVANQPKGTLEVQAIVTFNMPTDRKGTFSVVRDGDRAKARYAQLFKALAAVPSMAGQTAAGSQQDLPDVPMTRVVRFTVKGSQGNTLEIHSEHGGRSVTSDSEGVFAIPYDAALFRENPWVSWPVPTEGQEPTP